MDEKVFYQNNQVYVSNSRFVAGSKTYAMRNISSVSLGKTEPKRLFPIILIIIGIITIIAEPAQLILATLLIGGGVFWWYKQKAEYSVKINSNSGEDNSYSSADKELIVEIIAAVNSAIIANGQPQNQDLPNNKNTNVSEQLYKLAELKEKGLLTEEEFNQEKAKLLA